MHLRQIAMLLAAALLTGPVRLARADGVDDYLKAQMAARHIPGLSVAVVQDGRVVKSQGYGLADMKAKTAATPETVYEIGSLTKQFTAAAILRLREQKKIGIDDNISLYLNGLPAAWKVITVRELLNQTSGLPNYRDGLNYRKGGTTKDYTAAQVIALAAAKPLRFAPGTQFEYSNTNYHLLGMIVEKVSGQSYGDYLQKTFFSPLGMTRTRMAQPGSRVPDQAKGTLGNGTEVKASPFVFSPTINFGDDGILSSVTDLSKWNAALSGPTLLSADSKTLLWTPPLLPDGVKTEYASAWFSAPVQNHALLWHNGATLGGFTGAMFRFPDDRLTLIVLTNLLDLPGLQHGYPLYGLTLGLAKQYLPDLAKLDAGIPDTQPQTAVLLRTVAAQFVSDKVDKALFEPDYYRKVYTPAVVASFHTALAPFEPLSSLTLLRRSPNGIAVYRALYGTRAVAWMIAVDKEGKIAALGFQEME